MRVFVFLVSSIVENGAVLLLFKFVKFLTPKWFFSIRIFVFLVSGLLEMDFSMIFFASGIVEDGAVPYFYMNL